MVKMQTWYRGLCVATFVLILIVVAGQKANQFNRDLRADVYKSITLPAEERKARMCESLKQVAQDKRKYVPLSTLEKYCREESTNIYFKQIARGRTFRT